MQPGLTPSRVRQIAGDFARWCAVPDLARLLLGVGSYSLSGSTPEAAYQSMIRLFCRTRGLSNDLLHACIRNLRPTYRLPPASGILGDLGADEVGQIVATLRQLGYFVFPKRLSEAACDRLLQYALASASDPSPPLPGGPKRCVYDPARPLAPLYRFREEDLLENPDVQALICDPSVLAVAQAYLGCAPILDIIAMWWSTLQSNEPSADGAQLYHFDMDRVKWLKFFVYLTDVTPETGPHCFVAGSHRRGGVPAELLRQGYARLSDADVARHYPAEAFVEFTGPRGTIFAEDTRGLHKGVLPVSGHRLAFELEFCDSLFGGGFGRRGWKDPSPQLVTMAARYPQVYQKYAPRTAARAGGDAVPAGAA